MNESAMVKQPAWAPAINSSGLVPLPSPKRATNEYGVSFSVPLWVEIVPAPSLAVPCQRAEALRCIAVSLSLHFRPLSLGSRERHAKWYRRCRRRCATIAGTRDGRRAKPCRADDDQAQNDP